MQGLSTRWQSAAQGATPAMSLAEVPLLGRASGGASGGRPRETTFQAYATEAWRLLPIAGPVALQSAMGFSANLVRTAGPRSC